MGTSLSYKGNDTYMIILVYNIRYQFLIKSEKVFDKVQNPFMTKIPSKLGTQGNFFTLIMDIYRKLMTDIVFTAERPNVFSLSLEDVHSLHFYLTLN